MSYKSYKKAIFAYKKGDIKAAHAICVKIITEHPCFHESYYLLAVINNHVHQYAKAVALLKRAIAIEDTPKYRVELVKNYSLLGISDAVVAISNTIDIPQLSSFSDLDALGVGLSIVGLHQKALLCFERAIALNATPEILYNYGVSAKFCGEQEKALLALNRAVEAKPDYYQAHFALADLLKGPEIGLHIETLNKLLNKSTSNNDLSLEGVLHLSHALAKEYEKKEQYALAFESLARAKKLKKAQAPYERCADKRLFESLHQVVNTPPFNEPAKEASTAISQRPIFIVGMPRSGTTLVERILSSHSEVSSGGELEDFSLLMKRATKTEGNSVLDANMFASAGVIDFQQVAKDYLARTAHIGDNQGKFVDKLPFNFFYLPFIRQAFPHAKIICLLRNPLDTCVGNFRQLFSINNPHYNYTQSLEDCAWFYQQYTTWINLWSQTDLANTKLLSYEQLVTEPEHHVREILTFCGLAWEPQCLAVETNNAPVSTASKMQVREAINQRSIGTWKRYSPFTDQIEKLFSR
jgi:tetratricopeptide (TPR) repeat protein